MSEDFIKSRLIELNVNGTTYSQDVIAEVLTPSEKHPWWEIELRGGVVIYATGNITAVCNPIQK